MKQENSSQEVKEYIQEAAERRNLSVEIYSINYSSITFRHVKGDFRITVEMFNEGALVNSFKDGDSWFTPAVFVPAISFDSSRLGAQEVLESLYPIHLVTMLALEVEEWLKGKLIAG